MQKILWALIVAFCMPAFGQSTVEFMKEFRKNPRDVMNRLPQKYAVIDNKLQPVEVAPHFSEKMIQSRGYVHVKKKAEQACRRSDNKMAQEAHIDHNHIAAFFDGPIQRNLEQMERDRHMEGRAGIKPWSGDYWPIAKGMIAARNFDREFESLTEWVDRYQYTQTNPFLDIYQLGSDDELDRLAPSEKYELLLGDIQGTLTDNNWNVGQLYHNEKGEVEEWMGICHGWAPASYVVPEPKRSIDIQPFDNQRPIHLYPSELKGLVSYQWSKSNFKTRFVGQRCNVKDPEVDENGRIIDPKCFDLNPGTWHLAIVNQVGYLGKNFIMDATYDYEVWNQPIYQYSYHYFSPNDGNQYETLAEARGRLKDLEMDFFAKYRSPKAKYVVGVAMNVAYAVEIAPHNDDFAKEPEIVQVTYFYDLELDENNNILGGEWYGNNHPDFIWTPEDGENSHNYFDQYINEKLWADPNQPFPKKWQQIGKTANTYGLLLGKVMDRLIELAQ